MGRTGCVWGGWSLQGPPPEGPSGTCSGGQEASVALEGSQRGLREGSFAASWGMSWWGWEVARRLVGRRSQ